MWSVDSKFEALKMYNLGSELLRGFWRKQLDYRKASKLLSPPVLLEPRRQGVSSTIPPGENT